MVKCEFPSCEKGERCIRCGYELKRAYARLVRNCTTEFREPTPNPGLGDNMQRWLTSWGITKERWIEAKVKFGGQPTCNCDARQEWLNQIGAHFGIATDKYGPNKGEDNGH